MTRPLHTFTIELDGPDHTENMEAELQITHFTPGTPPTRHEPGDGPEVTIAPFVTILINGEPVGEMPFSLLVLEYASANHPGPVARAAGVPPMTLARAEEKIEDLAIEAMADRYSDEDDYGEDEYERRLERMECVGERNYL